MPQIGGQSRESRLDVDAVAIPADERLHGHRVPEVMQPGRERRPGADIGVLAETAECCLDRTRVEPCSAERHEEAHVVWIRAELIAAARVPCQRVERACGDGHIA
jgi:hypothetical protein